MNFAGIDIGATNLKIGIVTDEGEVLDFIEEKLLSSKGPEGVVAQIVSILENYLRKDVEAIGIGVPGPVDRNGVVHHPPNLSGWGDVALAPLVGEVSGFPADKIFVGNDANLACLAEHRFGMGKGCRNMVMLTLGTGVGGGVIVDGKLLLGKDGYAGELGHIQIDPSGPRCGCGRRGCAEAFIGHKGIVQTAWDVLGKDKGSLIWGMIRESGFDGLSPKHIQSAAELGDPSAIKIINVTARRLGEFIASLVNIFNPEKVIVGGGISSFGELLLGPAREIANRQALKFLSRDVKVVRAKFYQKAGVIGAGILALEKGNV